MHCDFACHLFSILKRKTSVEIVLKIVKEAVELEEEFVSKYYQFH